MREDKKELILEELNLIKEIDLNSTELTTKLLHVSDMLYLNTELFNKANLRAFYTQGMFIENHNLYNITGMCINTTNNNIYISYNIINEVGYVCDDIQLYIDRNNNYVLLLSLNDGSFRTIRFEKNPELNEKIMCLCEGRHDIPQAVDGAIFPQTIDVTNLKEMHRIVKHKLKDVTHLTLYVTGLTVALVKVINYCSIRNIELRLMHYNKDTNDYYPQIVAI